MIGREIVLTQSDTVRLLPSGRLKPPALQPLADTDDEFADLVRLESATHGRLRASASGLGGLDPAELVHSSIPGHTFINAAFAYPRPGGSRFSGGDRGAWYCGLEVETALKEVAFHLTRALADAGDAYDNTTDYAELFADFSGTFRDLRGLSAPTDCLHADCTFAYPIGQALAREILSAKTALGIVYPSVRHAGGTCLAALYPYVVQNVRQGGIWQLTWRGAPDPSIARLS